MLASPLRALEPPKFWAYTISMPKAIDRRKADPLPPLKVHDGPFQFNPHTHIGVTTMDLRHFYTPLTHINFFKIISNMPHLTTCYVEPADGVFPELDILDPTYSPDLAPPFIPQRGGHRISLEHLKHLEVVGKPSFCAAFMNECKILHSCSLAVNCKDCTPGPMSDPMDDILPQLRDRIEATLVMRDDFDDDDCVTETEQMLEINWDSITILDDTRNAPVRCNTKTRLTIENPRGIDHGYFLPQVLQTFGAPARPCIITLRAQEGVSGGHSRRALLDWLGGFDDCLNEIKFVGNHAFQFFAPLFMAVASNGDAICRQLIELHFEEANFGVCTPNQAMLLALLDFRWRRGAQIDRILFDECDGVRAEYFPVELEILIDGEDPCMCDDDDEDMADEGGECDGNESDATVRKAESDDEGDDMEVDL